MNRTRMMILLLLVVLCVPVYQFYHKYTELKVECANAHEAMGRIQFEHIKEKLFVPPDILHAPCGADRYYRVQRRLNAELFQKAGITKVFERYNVKKPIDVSHCSLDNDYWIRCEAQNACYKLIYRDSSAPELSLYLSKHPALLQDEIIPRLKILLHGSVHNDMLRLAAARALTHFGETSGIAEAFADAVWENVAAAEAMDWLKSAGIKTPNSFRTCYYHSSGAPYLTQKPEQAISIIGDRRFVYGVRCQYAIAGEKFVVGIARKGAWAVWDAESGTLLRSKEIKGPVTSLVALDDHRRFVTIRSSSDLAQPSEVQIWDIETGDLLKSYAIGFLKTGTITRVPNSDSVVIIEQDNYRNQYRGILNLGTGERVEIACPPPVKPCTFRSYRALHQVNEKTYLGYSNQTLELWSAASQPRISWRQPSVSEYSLSDDHRMLAYTSTIEQDKHHSYRVCRVLDLQTAKVILERRLNSYGSIYLKILSESLLCLRDGKETEFIRIPSGERIHSILLPPSLFRYRNQVLGGNCKRIWFADWDNLFRIDCQTGAIVPDRACLVQSALMINGGKHVYTTGPGGAAVWDASTGRLLHKKSAKVHTAYTVMLNGKDIITSAGIQHIGDDGSFLGMSSINCSQGWEIVSAARDGRALFSKYRRGREPLSQLRHVCSSYGEPLGIPVRKRKAILSPRGSEVLLNGPVAFYDIASKMALVRTQSWEGSYGWAISPESTSVAVAANPYQISIWCPDEESRNTDEFRRWRFLRSIEVDSGNAKVLNYLGSKYLAATGSCNIQIFDIMTGKLRNRFEGHVLPPAGVSATANGTRMASWVGGRALVWDTSIPSKAPTRPGTVRKTARKDLAPKHEDRIDWNYYMAQHEQTRLRVKENAARVLDMAATSDGSWIISVYLDGLVRIWNQKGECCKEILLPWGHAVRCAISSKRVAIGFPDGRICLASLEFPNLILTDEMMIAAHSDAVTSLSFSTGGTQLLSTAKDCTAAIWNTRDRSLVWRHRSEKPLLSGAFLPGDTRFIVGGFGGVLTALDLKGKRLLARLAGHEYGVVGVAVQPGTGRFVSVGRDLSGFLWDSSSFEQVASLTGHTTPITSCALLPDGQVVTASGSGGVRLWSSLTGSELNRFSMTPPHVQRLAACHDAVLIATQNDIVIRHVPKSTMSDIVKPRTVWRIPSAEMDFVWIPELNLWVGRYEVTNKQFRQFNPNHHGGIAHVRHKHVSLDSDELPVVRISHDEAVQFIRWLTQKEQDAGRIPSGAAFRLPDYAEWIAFAQCGTGRRYPWGNKFPPTRGNYGDWSFIEGNSGYGPSSEARLHVDGFAAACPVTMAGCNEWGLCGVGGNVEEWTFAPGNSKTGPCMDRSWAHRISHSRELELYKMGHGRFPTDSVGFRVVLGVRK